MRHSSRRSDEPLTRDGGIARSIEAMQIPAMVLAA
jgi:hypothetical protein